MSSFFSLGALTTLYINPACFSNIWIRKIIHTIIYQSMFNVFQYISKILQIFLIFHKNQDNNITEYHIWVIIKPLLVLQALWRYFKYFSLKKTCLVVFKCFILNMGYVHYRVGYVHYMNTYSWFSKNKKWIRKICSLKERYSESVCGYMEGD